MKILVADDDAISRSMMQRMLRQSGYEVTTVTDGTAALEQILDPDGPRMVLLDWMMPGLEGPDICRTIRSSNARSYVYIILLTSKESKEDLVAGLSAGADDFLTKPCNGEELRARLRTGHRILQLEDSLVEAREAMRFKATHDPLTLLLDRGAILQCFEAELAKAVQLHSIFSVLLCDVDRFKSVNDNHGHPVGDEVLISVAQRLLDSVRKNDGVGRYGGEEFLVVLPGCAQVDLQTRGERICQSMRSSKVVTSTGSLPVSVSVGALSIDIRNRDQSANALLREVDAALYQAKANGRDQVVLGGKDVERDLVFEAAES